MHSLYADMGKSLHFHLYCCAQLLFGFLINTFSHTVYTISVRERRIMGFSVFTLENNIGGHKSSNMGLHYDLLQQ